MYKPNILV